jgi:hypothetical protein
MTGSTVGIGVEVGKGLSVALGPGRSVGATVGRGFGKGTAWHADITKMEHIQANLFIGFM